MIKNKSSEFKQSREIEKQKFIADLEKKAGICRKFVADKRHAEYLEFFEGVVSLLRDQLESLAESAESTDKYSIQSLILTTKIATIKSVLGTPDKFIQAENKMKESEVGNG